MSYASCSNELITDWGYHTLMYGMHKFILSTSMAKVI